MTLENLASLKEVEAELDSSINSMDKDAVAAAIEKANAVGMAADTEMCVHVHATHDDP